MQKTKSEPVNPESLKSEPIKPKLKISTIKEWEEKTGVSFLLELPSGIVVEIKESLDLLDCAVSGFIPMPLMRDALAIYDKVKSPEQWTELDDKEMKTFSDMLKRVAVHSIKSPKLSLNGKGGGMNVDKISVADLLFIFNTSILEEKSELEPFLKE